MDITSTPGPVIRVGDVVQIDPAFEDKLFAGCFLTVTETKSWGVQGYVLIPQSKLQPPGVAYYRVNFSEIIKIGKAEWAIGESEEEEG
jgi:hypothetical protein